VTVIEFADRFVSVTWPGDGGLFGLSGGSGWQLSGAFCGQAASALLPGNTARVIASATVVRTAAHRLDFAFVRPWNLNQ
jgi:hypothetical protein